MTLSTGILRDDLTEFMRKLEGKNYRLNRLQRMYLEELASPDPVRIRQRVGADWETYYEVREQMLLRENAWQRFCMAMTTRMSVRVAWQRLRRLATER